MNYVAEPYVFLVDQLLTGLTGGEPREAHTFFPDIDGYSLSRPYTEVKVNSIIITGQASQAFTIFVPGRDWKLSAEGKIVFIADKEDAALPAANAVWPDEGADFFVSFYHDESDNALLTDRNVGSLNRTMAEAFSRELAILEKQLELVYRSGFIDTAKGLALEQVVALLGLKRKRGDYATGNVRFYRESAAPADIFIPSDTRVSTALNPPVSFVTTAGRTLRKGQLSVEARIRAEEKGADSVVAAAAISIINKAVHGVGGVTNDAPALFSGEKETDAELRGRARRVMQRAGRATVGAVINAVSTEAGLKENEIKLVEDFQAHPGIVKLFVARQPTAELASKVESALSASRPAGIRVEHNLKSALQPMETDLVSIEEGREEAGPVDDLSSATAGDGFSLPVKCAVQVYPENSRLTADEQETIKSAVVKAVYEFIDNAAIGKALIYNQLIADVMAIPGIKDVALDLYKDDDAGATGKKNLIVPDGQRALFQNKETDIQVSFIGAPVYFDFRFQVTLKGSHTLAEAELAVKQALVTFFLTSPTTVDGSALSAVLQPSDIYLLASTDQHWTVEYEQAGLTIKEIDEAVTLSAEEQAVLRKVTVEEKL